MSNGSPTQQISLDFVSMIPSIDKGIREVEKDSIEKNQDKPNLQARFEAFHRSNPHVLDAIIHMSREIKAAGRDRGSISQIFEVLRYSYSLRTEGDDYKLANAHRAFYARVVMELVPELSENKPFFLLSRQKEPYVIDWEALNITPPQINEA